MSLFSKLRSVTAAVLTSASALVSGWGSSGFDAANRSSRRGQVPGKGVVDFSRDFEEFERVEMVEQSRYIHKNSGTFRGYTRDMQTYSVGSGIRLQSKLDEPAWATPTMELFDDWGKNCDITGRFSLRKIQRLICRAMDVDGEIFVHKTYDEYGTPKIQLIETHRVGDFGLSDTVDGIKSDSRGRILWYRVQQDDGTLVRVPASAILHICDFEASSAGRGGPSMMHGITNAVDESELLAMEKHAVKDGADISRVITTEGGTFDDTGDFQPGIGDESVSESSNPATIQKITGGKVVMLKTGEKIEQFQNKRPSPTFTGFIQHLRRDTSMGLLPYEFTSEPSAVGGAGVRLVVAKADRIFSDRQDVLIEQFLESVWFFVVGWLIDSEQVEVRPGWWKVSAVTPRRITVDAGRADSSNRADIELGIKSLSDHFAELGGNMREEMRRRAEDMKYIQDLSEETGVPFDRLYNSMLKNQPKPAIAP